jgi:hypothetical protein
MKSSDSRTSSYAKGTGFLLQCSQSLSFQVLSNKNGSVLEYRYRGNLNQTPVATG